MKRAYLVLLGVGLGWWIVSGAGSPLHAEEPEAATEAVAIPTPRGATLVGVIHRPKHANGWPS